MAESLTPVYEAETVIKNEYDFRRELLSALEEDFSSNNEVKDTEIYRQHILHALGQEFDQDDIKQTNNFRAKVVEGVKELVNGGGGGDFSTAEVTVKMEGDGDYDFFYAPILKENYLIGFGEPEGDQTIFTVALYNGTAIAQPRIIDGSIHVSGNITLNNDNIIITGDGTVTIS